MSGLPSAQLTGVVLFNLGGPDTLDDVKPFLQNLFSDPEVIPLPPPFRQILAWWIATRRAPTAKGYYEKIGGGSPLRRLTADQAAALEKALSGRGRHKVVVAMRYWKPDTEDAVTELAAARPSRIVLLPLYPQYSFATTRSSAEYFRRVWGQRGLDGVPIVSIDQWHTHAGYLDAMAEQISATRAAMPNGDGSPVHLVYSAHGLPMKLIEQGDPYQRQVEEQVRILTGRLPEWASDPARVHLGYQSRVGRDKWLEPSMEELIHRLGSEGATRVLVVPVSFVSDHSETLYEIDIQYRQLAAESGIRVFARSASLNDSPTFIRALADLVASAA
ncbi:MAG TPA: ferrochelatase [Nitrospiria bacterium]|nr:ferrochelatase [Nitrospiria bacterium]